MRSSSCSSVHALRGEQHHHANVLQSFWDLSRRDGSSRFLNLSQTLMLDENFGSGVLLLHPLRQWSWQPNFEIERTGSLHNSGANFLPSFCFYLLLVLSVWSYTFLSMHNVVIPVLSVCHCAHQHLKSPVFSCFVIFVSSGMNKRCTMSLFKSSPSCCPQWLCSWLKKTNNPCFGISLALIIIWVRPNHHQQSFHLQIC